MQVSELNNAISALANVVKTYCDVSKPENAKIAFEAKEEEIKKKFEEGKERIINKFKEEKKEIDDLTEEEIITLKVTVGIIDEIIIDIFRCGKYRNGFGDKYIISFDINKKEIKVEKCPYKENDAPTINIAIKLIHDRSRPNGVVKIFKQGYDSVKHEFCFFDKNTKVDVFESVIEKVAKDLLDMIKNKSKDNITIIE